MDVEGAAGLLMSAPRDDRAAWRLALLGSGHGDVRTHLPDDWLDTPLLWVHANPDCSCFGGLPAVGGLVSLFASGTRRALLAGGCGADAWCVNGYEFATPRE
jgi:hypothetical protein